MSPISARLGLEGWDPEPSSSQTQEVILNIGFISLHLTLGKLFNFPEAEFLPLGKKKKKGWGDHCLLNLLSYIK